MNVTPLTIYLWQLCDEVKIVFNAISIIILISIAIIVFLTFLTDGELLPDANEDALKLWKWVKRAIIVMCISAVVGAIIPSSKTIAMMVVIPNLAESKVIQQDLPDLYNAAVQSLKDQLTKK
jgi:hypothetical protein